MLLPAGARSADASDARFVEASDDWLERSDRSGLCDRSDCLLDRLESDCLVARSVFAGSDRSVVLLSFFNSSSGSSGVDADELLPVLEVGAVGAPVWSLHIESSDESSSAAAG